MTSILPVVLAGGSGTRLWPLSRQLHPKQFMALTSGRSMLQETLHRLQPLPCEPPAIACNEEHRFLVAEQCRGIGVQWSAILLECASRNTAPAVALAACHALAQGSDPLLLVVPSDGHFEDDEAFRDGVRAAMEPATDGRLVAFGIRPSGPHTGYGYIRPGEPVGAARDIAAFIEKPNREKAQAFVDSGDFLWNSGVFLFGASRYLEELGRHVPAIPAACRQAVESGTQDVDFFRPGTAFGDAPDISVDHALMERTGDAVVVPLDVGWSDVGSWQALHDLGRSGDGNNALTGDVLTVRTTNTVVHATERLVATLGVDGLIVAETGDAVLVADRGEAQDVGDVVALIAECARREHHAHRRVHRPWGHFETIEAGPGHQVKRLRVNPRARLSMQQHRERSEHWIVVHGTAEVTRDGMSHKLVENASIHIPKGSWHRLSNPGDAPLELIEVQVGKYLGEDDIERRDDDFGRDGDARTASGGDEPTP